MKLKAIFFIALFLLSTVAEAFSVKYYNRDSKTYTWEIKVNGNVREITFNASTSGTANSPSSGDECEIKCECGWVKIEKGQKIEIKDGCIKVV